MSAPKAPKDPTKKGSSFYICREKEIAGSPHNGTEGMQYIYLDGGRLPAFAKMVGGVTEEGMLANLEQAKGFYEMVAGIGVTVENAKADALDFTWQMYGKKDPYKSGTEFLGAVSCDGMEKIFWLDDVTLSGDDDRPGQMRFWFPKSGMTAKISVRLYLREGFEAPPQEESHPVDTASEGYQRMIARSLMSSGNPYRLEQFLNKLKAGNQATIAFIGGSITQGAGAVPIHEKSYAYQTYVGLKNWLGVGENLSFIKAGVGGTPSELGMIRFERDVLQEGALVPDCVVIEFAVNDAGDETNGICYESLVRKCLALREDVAVILLFSVFTDGYNLQDRLAPVGIRYDLPMVSLKNAVTKQFDFPWPKEGEAYDRRKPLRILSRNQYFYDAFHPTNLGHQIMADCLLHLFKQVAENQRVIEPAAENTDYHKTKSANWREKKPVYGADFENVRLLDRHTGLSMAKSVEAGSFLATDEALQRVEMHFDFAPTPQFPYNWKHEAGSEPFVLELDCKGLLIVTLDGSDINAGKAVCKVDGEVVRLCDPKEVGWTHCNPQILLNEKETKRHRIEVAMAEGEEDKWFTILGFGVVE